MPAMPELRRRVWSLLERADSVAVVPARPRLQAVAVAAAIMLLAGTAGAMISGRWIVPALERSGRAFGGSVGGGGDGSNARGRARPEKARSVRRVAAAESLEPVTADAPLPALVRPEPVSAAPTGGGISRRAATAAADRGVGRAPAVATRGAVTSAQERTEVLDALIALRRDHDPLRAGALLDRYLVIHPRGALREEARVLAIEAADARGDRPRALKLALSYQADYPVGRFRQFARSHIESNGSRSPSPGVSLDGSTP
jgi:hypothetical protein